MVTMWEEVMRPLYTEHPSLEPKSGDKWGKRNGCGAKEGENRFHGMKGDDLGARGDDDYSVNPATGDVVGPDGEFVGNLGDEDHSK